MKRLYVICLLLFGLAISANAQPGSPSPWNKNQDNQQTLGGAISKPPPSGSSGSPVTAPIDGGLSLLLAAGALYGKRVYGRKTAAKAANL